jgi:C1A family cysteine protease
MVEKLNQLHAGTTSFRGNHLLDMTAKEVLRIRGGKSKGSRAERRLPEHWQFVREHQEERNGLAAEQVPTNFDWRVAKPGSVTPVKDQAMCGSCWTYGLTEPVESIQAIVTGKLVELPEQFVVDCTWTNGTSMNMGCDGGNSDVGALEIVRKFGGKIPTAAAYGSYLSVNGYCKDTARMEVGAVVSGWVDVPKRNEQALMHALFTVGPVSVGIQVPDEMLFYDTGVLKVQSCKHDESQIDHAVTATGFGTDGQGTPFWTIRNSWSTYWGDKGYINIARGELDCCVSCEAGYPDMKPGHDLLVV